MIDFKAMREKIKQVHRLNRAVQRIYAKATGTTITITDMPKAGGVGNKLQNDVVELVTVKEEYETAKKELDEMKSQLMAKMKKLDKWQHIAVIRKRYIEEKSVNSIMDEIGYEETQTKRFLTTAEELINKLV